MKPLKQVLCKQKSKKNALNCRATIDFERSKEIGHGLPVIVFKCECTRLEDSKANQKQEFNSHIV
ncbi:MAG: hypothetical protein GY781_13715 [Gammaproteobacteria bacterium]|nr:hypothetical protein [Gammaproteobacteria bacterium]